MEYFLFVLSAFVSLLIRIFHKSVIKEINRILLIRLDHLGDMVLTLPALKNLRDNYPGAKITLLTGSWDKSLFENYNLVDEVLTYDCSRYTRNKNEITTFKEKVSLFFQLRRINPEIIIGFRDDLFTVIISFLLFPFKRLDRGSVRLKKKFSDMFVQIKPPELHELETNGKIISSLITGYNEEPLGYFHFSEMEELSYNNLLNSIGLSDRYYAILHPGAAWIYRRWDYNNFIKTGEYLFKKYSMRSLIIGTPDELDTGKKIADSNSGVFINLIGLTTLRMSIQLIKSAKIVVCNDSSPMHLSSILQKNTIALLGPQSIERFGPRGEKVIYFHKKVECFPCKQIICKYPKLPCVNLNSVDEVTNGIDILLNQS